MMRLYDDRGDTFLYLHATTCYMLESCYLGSLLRIVNAKLSGEMKMKISDILHVRVLINRTTEVMTFRWNVFKIS